MPVATPLEIGLRIRKARQAKGLSQTACAKLAGTTRPHWTGWESGKHIPGQFYRPILTSLLGVDFADLEVDEDEAEIRTLQEALEAARARQQARRAAA